MSPKPIASNMSELEFKKHGVLVKVLISYKTPVAYTKEWRDGGFVARRTSQYYSRTTSRHINKWLGKLNRCECNQAEINALVK